LRSNQKKNLCLPKFSEDQSQSQEKRGRLPRALKEIVSFLRTEFPCIPIVLLGFNPVIRPKEDGAT
jgi:hypothetical protein